MFPSAVKSSIVRFRVLGRAARGGMVFFASSTAFQGFAFAFAVLAILAASSAGAASFVTNGPLATARYYHTATLLPSGKVLVAGGQCGTFFTNGAELYDPANGTWTATGAMTADRSQHTATLSTPRSFTIRPPGPGRPRVR
jgi:hypothetical protein